LRPLEIMKRDSEIWLQTNVARHSPLLSIITVVFRARRDLPDLIDSVLRVKDETTEFIVIDGGSDDGTRELLCQYGSAIDYWVSEPDKGIYDAMNKGIAAAQGTFMLETESCTFRGRNLRQRHCKV
jgi:glycosyltransferase involved in cell wall biosynthesis